MWACIHITKRNRVYSFHITVTRVNTRPCTTHNCDAKAPYIRSLVVLCTRLHRVYSFWLVCARVCMSGSERKEGRGDSLLGAWVCMSMRERREEEEEEEEEERERERKGEEVGIGDSLQGRVYIQCQSDKRSWPVLPQCQSHTAWSRHSCLSECWTASHLTTEKQCKHHFTAASFKQPNLRYPS